MQLSHKIIAQVVILYLVPNAKRLIVVLRQRQAETNRELRMLYPILEWLEGYEGVGDAYKITECIGKYPASELCRLLPQ